MHHFGMKNNNYMVYGCVKSKMIPFSFFSPSF